MQHIYIVRHGETDVNVRDEVNDRRKITPINDRGKKQAIKTGKYLNKLIKSDSTVIYSSSCTRAVQTAEIISNSFKKPKPIIQDKRIIELDYGILSGSKPNDKIMKEYMKEYNKFAKDPIDLQLRWTEFDNIIYKKFKSEQLKPAKKRSLSFMKSLPKDTKNIIIVSHGGILQIIIKVLFNIEPNIMGDLSNGNNCTITFITREKNNYNLLTLPNTLHLAGMK